jgi:GNAT superfamily N-acetyltransferase
MRVRRAVRGEERVLAALNLVVQALHVAARPESFASSEARLDEVEAWFALALRTDTMSLWLAEVHGEAVGYALAELRVRPPNPFAPAARWCEIDQVAVRPEHQGRGVGRALIEAAVQEARAQGVRQVELCTWAFNEQAARRFQQLGFRPKLVRYELTGG